MASLKLDTILSIWRTTTNRIVGTRSPYFDTPHPATNKKIEGWQWDQKLWSSAGELDAVAYAPSLWDPIASGILDEDIINGIGDNNDLLLLDVSQSTLSGQHHWSPEINHGYYYINNQEWYFYADQYLTEYFQETTVTGTNQVLHLSHRPKPGVPVQVRRYQYERSEGKYLVDLDFRKKVEFTESGTEPEFIVDTDYDPPHLELNGIYPKQIGGPVTSFPADINALELLGYSTEEDNQEFQLEFYPVDRAQPTEIWTWNNPVSGYQAWTIVSGLDSPTGNAYEVYLDYDLGLIRFGNYDVNTTEGDGRVPPLGHKVGAYYHAALAVHYEPENTKDSILVLNSTANLNPIYASISAGFVQLNNSILEPDSIVLDADLPRINPFLINLGNNVGELRATVRASNGVELEGYQVFFEILDPIIGSFGTSLESTSSITRAGGIARTNYNAPRIADDIGQATIEVEYSGLDTTIYVNGLTDPGDVNSLSIYQIHEEDVVLGMPSGLVDTYYSDYLSEEGIVSGVEASQTWEVEHRSLYELPTPLTYADGDLTTGKKTILLTYKPESANVVDPNTGDYDGAVINVFSPLRPTTITDLSANDQARIKLDFENITLSAPTVSGVKSYFVVGDALTSLRAYTINPRTKQRVYSNTIQMKILIPRNLTGSYFADDLNELSALTIATLLKKPRDISAYSDNDINLTSGYSTNLEDYLEERVSGLEPYADWFRRTRRADSKGLELMDQLVSGIYGPEDIELIAASGMEIPLGFRLSSAGITAASMLDQVTFITPNDTLLSGYFNIE